MTEAKDADFGLPPKAETLEEKIARLESENATLRAAAEKPAAEADDVGTLDTNGFPKEYVFLEIYPGREKHDLSYVPLGIKGYALKVQRGVRIIVPKVFVDECLAHAVEEITTQSEGGLVTRPALRFPFQVYGPATEEQYLAQQAKAKALSGAGQRA